MKCTKFKNKTEKGITLIALIITIVVLMILAAVAITSITNEGILNHANNAVVGYEEEKVQENTTLDSYQGLVDKWVNGLAGKVKTVAEVKNIKQEKNTKVVDEYGNQIVIPAGFKIRVDEGTRTLGDEKSTATDVTQGIVIEDASGNQFVWVPVGDIYTTADTATKETTKKTIPLGRYSNFTATDGVYTLATSISDYTEETATATGLGTNGNAVARNINDFITSANQNKGYYIGRFEAGISSNTLVCKAGETVYGSITQPDASTACKNMYNNGADGYKAETFSSDLINSYAWDTAIIFIQTFGIDKPGEENTNKSVRNYASLNKSTSFTTTGGNGDEYCNINDMSGNAYEWSTETCSTPYNPCVTRGGSFITGSIGPDLYTAIVTSAVRLTAPTTILSVHFCM